MAIRILLVFCLSLIIISCTKKEPIYEASKKIDPFKVYKEGLDAIDRNDFFFASKKFSEAELNFNDLEFAAKSSIMRSFSLYSINFYGEAIENLNSYLKTYPADKNVIYANYLIALIYFEQISDEKKDLGPLLKAQKQIKFFLEKFPDTEYAIDLKFKNDLIQNQMAAKELYVAKFYITTQKWIPAINRLKVIVDKYEKTIFIEEALHRLVEIHYYLGLEEEAKSFAKILGYNYNSSEWFKQSYKILNQDYKIEELKQKVNKKEKENLIKKIIRMIR